MADWVNDPETARWIHDDVEPDPEPEDDKPEHPNLTTPCPKCGHGPTFCCVHVLRMRCPGCLLCS